MDSVKVYAQLCFLRQPQVWLSGIFLSICPLACAKISLWVISGCLRNLSSVGHIFQKLICWKQGLAVKVPPPYGYNQVTY